MLLLFGSIFVFLGLVAGGERHLAWMLDECITTMSTEEGNRATEGLYDIEEAAGPAGGPAAVGCVDIEEGAGGRRGQRLWVVIILGVGWAGGGPAGGGGGASKRALSGGVLAGERSPEARVGEGEATRGGAVVIEYFDGDPARDEVFLERGP
ncbi:hypothetical protein CYMTET_33604 [Cymbomonas tetramitiformis]|uniref:Uncharacterized protein n=1 Tax=Cymbomonas tetramitiformis TaxID=36881 RepID=A0AAE0FCV1_9CHLO|nr:hypothetical protein CYMTET_33604 [Cymbomonas tetramitiformis]